MVYNKFLKQFANRRENGYEKTNENFDENLDENFINLKEKDPFIIPEIKEYHIICVCLKYPLKDNKIKGHCLKKGKFPMAGDDEDNNNKYKHRGYEILSFMYIIMKGETVIIKWDILEPILDGILD